MSVEDALQLMLSFGTFIVIALLVELIKSQQKTTTLALVSKLLLSIVKICHRL